jgi:hypothetical protein
MSPARLHGWRLRCVAWMLDLPIVGMLLARHAAARLSRGLDERR